jgi:tetratricopeptide (TPR) repeat protein
MLMRALILCCPIVLAAALWAQNAPGPSNSPADPAPPAKSPEKQAKPRVPDLTPPSSDHVNASALQRGESSSKDDEVDLSPPPEDLKAHPEDSSGAGRAANPADVNEFRPWDPHKAAKDVEVGDFYFKQKNYRGAESRYREALFYKDNDATATFRLAVCLEKMNRPDEARQEYESYLKILPSGPEASKAKKALERLHPPSEKTSQK